MVIFSTHMEFHLKIYDTPLHIAANKKYNSIIKFIAKDFNNNLNAKNKIYL